MSEHRNESRRVERHRWRWLVRHVAIVGLVVVCAAAFWAGSKTRRWAVQNAELVIPDECLDLGEIWESKDFHWQIRIKNESAENREVQAFITSCTCLKIEPSSLMIPAGGTAQCQLTLDLTRGRRSTPESAIRLFQVRIIPQIKNAVVAAPGWKIQGRVRQPFIIKPVVVDFGATLMRGKGFPSQFVNVQSKVPLRQFQTILSDESLADTRTVKCASDDYQVSITPKPTVPKDIFDFTINLQAIDESGNKLTGTIPVRCRILEAILVTPREILFGVQPLGRNVEESITLQSRDGEKLTLCGIDAEPETVKIKRIDGSADSDRLVLSVKIQIMKMGEQRGIARIHVQRQGVNKKEEIALHYSYHGAITEEQ